MAAVQVGGDGGTDPNGKRRASQNWSHSGYMLEVRPTIRQDVGGERWGGVKDDSTFFAGLL